MRNREGQEKVKQGENERDWEIIEEKKEAGNSKGL